MKNNMDYIYMAEDQKILIELMQESTRQSVIEQYVQCRKRQDMTQAELAAVLGVTERTLRDWESGVTVPDQQKQKPGNQKQNQ